MEKSFAIALSEMRYIDYLAKTGELTESKLKDFLFKDKINADKKDVMTYFLKESVEKSDELDNLEEMEVNKYFKMSTKDLANKVAKQGTELEKLLEQAKKTPQGKKQVKILEKQIKKIKKMLKDIENIDNAPSAIKVILLGLWTLIKVELAFMVIYLGGMAITYYIAYFAGLNAAAIVSSFGNPLFIAYASSFLCIVALMALIRRIVMISTKRELTTEEKEKIDKKASSILKKTKDKIEQLRKKAK